VISKINDLLTVLTLLGIIIDVVMTSVASALNMDVGIAREIVVVSTALALASGIGAILTERFAEIEE